jgi:transcriptional regulator with XRE-family HTH domain
MAKRKKKVAHSEMVRLFAARLREVRVSRGLTQAALAHQAHVSEAYVGRLERGETTPGIDLVARLAQALGTTANDLMPTGDPPDTLAVLQGQARSLFDGLLQTADRETLLLLNPLLQMLAERTK